MTVKEFIRMCDISDAVLTYYALTKNNNPLELTYRSTIDTWVSEDWDYNEDDEIVAEMMIDSETMLNAEIVNIKLGKFTDITVRV